jgi:hypothetical protein
VGTAYAIKPAYFFLGRKTFMAPVIDRRVTAQIEGDFVVFLIGMRINKPWKPHKWLLNLRTMPKMLKELEAAPAENGFLGCMNLGLLSLVQYCRSFDHLEAYAPGRDKQHWPAWLEFNRLMKDSRGDVGIWHETISSEPANAKASIAGCRLWASQKLPGLPMSLVMRRRPEAVWAPLQTRLSGHRARSA